jgi:hypothetical protein
MGGTTWRNQPSAAALGSVAFSAANFSTSSISVDDLRLRHFAYHFTRLKIRPMPLPPATGDGGAPP